MVLTFPYFSCFPYKIAKTKCSSPTFTSPATYSIGGSILDTFWCFGQWHDRWVHFWFHQWTGETSDDINSVVFKCGHHSIIGSANLLSWAKGLNQVALTHLRHIWDWTWSWFVTEKKFQFLVATLWKFSHFHSKYLSEYFTKFIIFALCSLKCQLLGVWEVGTQ